MCGDELGRGGMGVVYRAVRRGDERPVALKLLVRGAAAEFAEVARFWAEACALAALDHPHILKIRTVGVWQGCPYLVMDHAAGGSLRGRTGTPWAVAEAVGLAATVADALAHAHARGILHRDLKPANVLLDAAGAPLVADFGLVKFTCPERPDHHPHLTRHVGTLTDHLEAMGREFNAGFRDPPAEAAPAEVVRDAFEQVHGRTGWRPDEATISHVGRQLTENWRPGSAERAAWAEGQSLTADGTALGTPAYMAPEQWFGGQMGPWTDVFGLGGLLYDLLTGRPPFDGSLSAILQGEVRPVDEGRAEVPGWLDRVCRKCLAAAPADRYPDAAAVRDVLRAETDPGPTATVSAGRRSSPANTATASWVPGPRFANSRWRRWLGLTGG